MPRKAEQFHETPAQRERRLAISAALLRQLPEVQRQEKSLHGVIGLNTEQFPFLEIPNEVGPVLIAIEEWSTARDLLPGTLEQARAFISMVAHLHPYFAYDEEGNLTQNFYGEHFEDYLKRLELVGKYYAWLFYLDDKFGNDVQEGLPDEEQGAIDACKEHIYAFLNHEQSYDECLDNLKNEKTKLTSETHVSNLINAFVVFQELGLDLQTMVIKDSLADGVSQGLPLFWLKTLDGDLKDHLMEGLSPQHINNVRDYVDRRRLVSGMVPAAMFVKFATQSYPDTMGGVSFDTKVNLDENRQPMDRVDALRDQVYLPAFADIGEKLCPVVSGEIPLRLAMLSLRTCCIDYGGLVNDLVSLHKELTESTLFNLAAVVYLASNEEVDLVEIIDQIGVLMAMILQYGVALFGQIIVTIQEKLASNDVSDTDKDLLRRERNFATGLYYGMLSTYYWQVSEAAAARYKGAPFQEFAPAHADKLDDAIV